MYKFEVLLVGRDTTKRCRLLKEFDGPMPPIGAEICTVIGDIPIATVTEVHFSLSGEYQVAGVGKELYSKDLENLVEKLIKAGWKVTTHANISAAISSHAVTS
jgi:hypothetical protein